MRLAFLMEFLFSMALLLCLMACQAEMKDSSTSMPLALSYWNHKLPTTPIPTLLLARLSSLQPNTSSYPNQVRIVLAKLIVYSYTASENMGNHSTTSVSSGTIFFLQKNIGIGSNFSVDMVDWKNTETLNFIPAVLANEIPFSTKNLSVSLNKLHISPDSGMALTMKQTLEICEKSTMIGESKKCVTSLESMIDYSTSQIGTNDVNVFVVNVSMVTKSGLQQYSLASIPFESKPTSRVVACHTIRYAYLVYLCHQIKDTRIYKLSLKTDEGNVAEMLSLCHEDTSQWSPEHVSFKMLHVKPGGEAICHFMPDDSIVWVAAN
ncbi:hypothetical protein SUGI_0694710 [Cryptomeria japonica]|uniref:BURP domain-containing protein 3 n=1 Tax=Cryptomeria japonica TaxID=3369 RepID=UPI002414702E|nr:BURP domain-containing protein 3 [Cryptomeria japonica]GLJ34541.1 hypothetical protein SUGI_0694710 [Cryptomeria japonica]